MTMNNNSFALNIALDYGGRWDIVRAAKKMAADAVNKRINLARVDERSFSKYMCLSTCPEPDFLIRTSGELRISNFLLWQLAYAELYFVDIFWPEFDEKILKAAIEEYSRRKQRFGSASS